MRERQLLGLPATACGRRGSVYFRKELWFPGKRNALDGASRFSEYLFYTKSTVQLIPSAAGSWVWL